MINTSALLVDLKRQVAVLEDDLLVRAVEDADFDVALRREWRLAHERSRIAAPYDAWLDGQVTQAAVAWVLGTVFLRFCEDNGLIDLPYLAGPGDRLAIATERQRAFFERHPKLTDRGWILEGFAALSQASGTARLFDPAHNPLWQITPSHQAAKELLGFWRRRSEGSGAEVVHDFTDPDLSTRFLGDLYQDLSEHAKKTFALLQTPEFVEEFILNLSLDPAIDEFGLDPEPPEACPKELGLPRGLRVIDPTCGSGHFLLGAFHRILTRWEQQAPGVDRWDLINRTLYSVHGVDKNPFAVAIARFRLLIAAMQAGGVKRLADTPGLTLNIAVGDSLLHGRGGPGFQGDLFGDLVPYTYTTEDVTDYARVVDLLGVSSYHVVVGNPPYITPKDEQENENYRVYLSCSGRYSLSVPFSERFYQLAIRGGGDWTSPGYVGQITANSFMRREFGRKLVEECFSTIELTHVIDTSGAYIPGHGTPTVILIGRRRPPGDRPVRAVLGVRGEPSRPDIPAEGKVWRAIVEQVHKPGSESHWIAVTDLERDRLLSHPWNLSGSGARGLLEAMSAGNSLGDHVARIGYAGTTGLDDVFIAKTGSLRRTGAEEGPIVRLLTGSEVRDWTAMPVLEGFHPRADHGQVVDIQAYPHHFRRLWPYRALLVNRPKIQETGRPWYDWHHVSEAPASHQQLIVFPWIASHNHFVVVDGSVSPLQSAPIIRLHDGAELSEYINLTGFLNSSAVCFWIKHTHHTKGAAPDQIGVGEPWANYYEITGRKLRELPLPQRIFTEPESHLGILAAQLHAQAAELVRTEPAEVCAQGTPTQRRLDEARDRHNQIRSRMIALQEELDWEAYRLYGLLSTQEAAELRAAPESTPELELGQRAFEIALARRAATGEVDTHWFTRHGSTPSTEVPTYWPEEYKQVVERRIEVIERRRGVALIEQPEYKRRWFSAPWERREKEALRGWLLGWLEDRSLWYFVDEYGAEQPRVLSVRQLADRLRSDVDVVSVARLYAGPDAELSSVLAEILDTEHVPYLAALRYKESGLRKRAQWEKTWDLQRKEDQTDQRLDIDVPPRYASADFLKSSYWSNRGKSDVPKERFISYPLASPDGDPSLLLGWAGWDHREQAHALMTLIEERSSHAGWGAERLTPLIAGLAEVLPWVQQWHGEIDPEFGISPATAYASYLDDQLRRLHLDSDLLKEWRPQPPKRGRPPKNR